ncbi:MULTISPECIES: 1-acyl-sn-glycerol-3-phosphate acyltransferase [unclassified Arenibacter]|jgi:1-acyl-sn-glycerol-3-phosphate acyltransferase|uniref:1-acyl-sn-glycerol-3-phosphate acyltransferase n=1 Tax=unclassified Arenibacter TaxID=2615047 RepID=UPI000E34BE0A|nr:MULTISPECIES: 1-acyl-sn-glycerol-3-phosphate acyltransferase [unclassified Arenibacter]MCM4165167.1 acyltransferase [Arenibacter sp. A80]RFT55029.1 acyltransferase [Arenibacter sp. P308M17]
MQTLAKFIYFKILGWTLVGSFPQLDKCIVIVVPHTSWVDFFLGLLIRKVLNEEIHFIAKKALFKPPFGWYFRWMGGTPIDRNKNMDTVGATAKIFDQKKRFRLALSPEGTRKKVAQWKTGFYFIAKGAKVPIVMVAFDFGKKQVKISGPQYPTDDQEADFASYKAFFEGVVGKVPENSF